MTLSRPSSRRHSERGAALIVAILGIVLLAALGTALIVTTTTEIVIAAHHRRAIETFYAAEAGLERALVDLLRQPDWSLVLNGLATSSFSDDESGVLPDGAPLALTARTAELQADSDRMHSGDPNRPVWRLFAHDASANLLGPGAATAREYLVVWVADDPAENDGDPTADANGVVLLRCEAFGDGSSRKVVESTIGRSQVVDSVTGEARAVSRVLVWREVR